MPAGGGIDREIFERVAVPQEHWKRMTVEQQAERRLLSLQVGDVDADSAAPAVGRPPLHDLEPAIAQQPLFFLVSGQAMPLQPCREPFLRAVPGFRISPGFQTRPE